MVKLRGKYENFLSSDEKVESGVTFRTGSAWNLERDDQTTRGIIAQLEMRGVAI